MTTLQGDAVRWKEEILEEQLKGGSQILERTYSSGSKEMTKEETWHALETGRKPCPDVDYKKELALYREKKYGTPSFA